jgi:hypothetical protein
MNAEQIKYMVNRFLAWRLPENFNPDGGISFKRMRNEQTSFPAKNEPVGTNLLDAVQAEEMIRHLLDGLPDAPIRASSWRGSPSFGERKSTLGTIPCPQEQTQDLEEKWADPYGKDFVRYSENQLEAAKKEAYQSGEKAMVEKAACHRLLKTFRTDSKNNPIDQCTCGWFGDSWEDHVRSLAGAVPHDANQKRMA